MEIKLEDNMHKKRVISDTSKILKAVGPWPNLVMTQDNRTVINMEHTTYK